MKYTEAEIEQIIDQLRRIKIRDVPVFIAILDETNRPYHTIHIDSGPTVARLEFENAHETEGQPPARD